MVDISKFAEEEALGPRLEIVGRNVLVTEAMKNYAVEKLSKITRLHAHILDIHMTLDIQKLEHSVVIILRFEHFHIKVQASSTDMYASIDKAIDRLQKQLRRWKERIQDHHKKDVSSVDLTVNVVRRPYDEIEEYDREIEAQAEEEIFLPARVIAKKMIALKTLTTEEALMKLDLSGDNFLIFRGEEDQRLKVMYRRKDNNYGIIAVE
jgi:putative sigma-54 modulation protein